MKTSKTIDVGVDFSDRLANRNADQGDGKNTAIEFRHRYLRELENAEAWKDDQAFVTFDFSKVKKIGPSFANEAFAYFVRYASPDRIRHKILFTNITPVKLAIIDEELESATNQHLSLS